MKLKLAEETVNLLTENTEIGEIREDEFEEMIDDEPQEILISTVKKQRLPVIPEEPEEVKAKPPKYNLPSKS